MPVKSPLAGWDVAPKTVVLSSDDVHVWCAELDQTTSCMHDLQQTLDTNERVRAERFYFRRDRDQFIVAHGLLRVVLSRYLTIEPSDLRFCYNPYGKPMLAKEVDADGLRFNLSHSHGLVLYAVTRARELGIDIERIRPDVAYEQLAERFFSSREVAALRAVHASHRLEAFFNCWTRKEAYIKARGEGLSLPLDHFDVSLAPGEPATLLSTIDDPLATSRWSLRKLDLAPGYTAALAVEGHGWRLKFCNSKHGSYTCFYRELGVA
ncbi:MAG: 4'-phosphopantetheinyl transferase family protein [Gammaproteobacteria bacterium]